MQTPSEFIYSIARQAIRCDPKRRSIAMCVLSLSSEILIYAKIADIRTARKFRALLSRYFEKSTGFTFSYNDNTPKPNIGNVHIQHDNLEIIPATTILEHKSPRVGTLLYNLYGYTTMSLIQYLPDTMRDLARDKKNYFPALHMARVTNDLFSRDQLKDWNSYCAAYAICYKEYPPALAKYSILIDDTIRYERY